MRDEQGHRRRQRQAGRDPGAEGEALAPRHAEAEREEADEGGARRPRAQQPEARGRLPEEREGDQAARERVEDRALAPPGPRLPVGPQLPEDGVGEAERDPDAGGHRPARRSGPSRRRPRRGRGASARPAPPCPGACAIAGRDRRRLVGRRREPRPASASRPRAAARAPRGGAASAVSSRTADCSSSRRSAIGPPRPPLPGAAGRRTPGPQAAGCTPVFSSVHGGSSFTSTHRIAKGRIMRRIAGRSPSRVANSIL